MLVRLLEVASRVAGVLNHDFCPGANRWVYWLKHPSVPLGAAAAAALVCGVFVNPQAFVLAAALVGVLVLGAAWPWLGLWGLSAELEFDRSRGMEGEPVGLRLRIRNRCPWPVWGLALDRGFRRFDRALRPCALARVAGWSTSEYRFSFVPTARGEYPTEPVALQTSFPFGLWSGRATVRVGAALLVWPRLIPLESIPDAADLSHASDRVASNRVGDHGDLMGTRLFRAGDSLRRVHWVQTARLGRLIVCERQLAAQSAVSLELDLDPASHSPPGPDGTLEWTLRLAASIADCLHGHHARVVVESPLGRTTWLEGASGRCKGLDQLARVPDGGVAGNIPAGTLREAPLLRFVCTTPVGWLKRRTRGGAANTTRVVLVVPAGTEPESLPPLPRGSLVVWAGPVPQETRHGECHDEVERERRIRRLWERSCHAAAE
ncbi:MAG: DUF58 domain-containing protein [Planctomycetaceae bacterium]